MKYNIIGISLLLLFSFSCQAKNNNQYCTIFNEIVSLIDANYFDGTVKENSFYSVAQVYKAMLSECQNEEEFISIVNSFLFTFNVSHIGFGKVSDLREKTSPYIWYEYETGIDVRIIRDEVFVTAVNDSICDNKQIKMGDRIIEINSRPIDEILSEFRFRPPDNQRNYNFLMTEEILRNIYGYDNSEVYLTTFNSSNVENTIAVQRKKRGNGTLLFEGFPNVFLDIKSNVYFDSIGYIKFNAFQPGNPKEIINIINDYKSFPGLIIDLRGNNGGSVEATKRIAEELLKSNDIYYSLVGSNDISRITYHASKNPFKGNLIVLVDELSISAAEIFSDILQYTKSGKIVGQQTPGNVLSGELFQVSDNYNLLLPTQDWIRDDGFRLEGSGVIPDYIIDLKEDDLKKGIDTQLDFALDILK